MELVQTMILGEMDGLVTNREQLILVHKKGLHCGDLFDYILGAFAKALLITHHSRFLIFPSINYSDS